MTAPTEHTDWTKLAPAEEELLLDDHEEAGEGFIPQGNRSGYGDSGYCVICGYARSLHPADLSAAIAARAAPAPCSGEEKG